jgi:hypothetical protein
LLPIELLVQASELVPHLDCASHSPQGVVLVQRRDPEDGHDRVANEFLDRAAVALQ